MVAKYNPKLAGFDTTNHKGATGDGIVMAEAIGAALRDMEYIQIHPTVVPGKGVLLLKACVAREPSLLTARVSGLYRNSKPGTWYLKPPRAGRQVRFRIVRPGYS